MPTYPKKSSCHCMADGGKVKKAPATPPAPAAPTPPSPQGEAKSFLDGLKALNADVKSGKVGGTPSK